MTKCAIWDTVAKDLESNRDGAAFDSPRAGGKYFISRTAVASIRPLSQKERARLTTYLVNQRQAGVEIPEINSDLLPLAANARALAVPERADRLLGYFAASNTHLGEAVGYDLEAAQGLEMMAVSESINIEEVVYLSEYLARIDRIDLTKLIGAFEITISVKGYERLAEIEASGAASTQAFVAMWFNADLDSVYTTGIAPGIADAGYAPMRIDKKDHNNKIDDEIIAEIRRSRLLVADFTHGADGPRGGVYYEAGFAHGLGIPVIFMCRADMISKVHFDTRQYSHILWDDAADARKKLSSRISATLGDGPLKKQ